MSGKMFGILCLSVPMFGFLIGCIEQKKEDANSHTKLFKEYFEAVQNNSVKKWNYTTDTVRIWFDEKGGEPIEQIKGKGNTGKWKEWDQEMRSTYHYDSLWLDKSQNAVKAIFYENNDFYKLIGKPPTKTLRTYWFDSENRINEILIYWIPNENTTTDQHLKPIVEWALENDSVEISALYKNNQIVPSKENARRWKDLLRRFNTEKSEN